MNQPAERPLSSAEQRSELSGNVFISVEVNQRVEGTVQAYKTATYPVSDVDPVRPLMTHLLFGEDS